MSKYSSGDVAFFIVDGYDLKGVETEFTFDVEAGFEDTHGLGRDWRDRTPVAERKADLSQAGFYDDAADSVNAALNELQNTSRVVFFGVAGNAVGRKFTGMQGAYGGKYTRLMSRGSLHKANASYQVSGQVDEGLILQELEAKTADWDTTGADSVDNGASTSNGAVGYMAVVAMTGFTGFVGKIKHSADDSTYVDLITFSNVTAAPAAQRGTAAGTVNRHLAFAGDVTGAGSIQVICGCARN